MRIRTCFLAFACGLSLLGLAQAARNPAPAAAPVRAWSAAGGDVGIRWNRELVRDLGLRLQSVASSTARDGSDRFRAEPAQALRFDVDNGYLRGFAGGALRVRGGYTLRIGDDTIDLREFRLVPAADGRSLRLDIVDARGVAWFHVDRIMHELFDAQRALAVSSSDIRVSTRLAQRLGQPEVAGWTVGELQLDLPVATRGSGAKTLAPSIVWHGDPAPGGDTYKNDLFMHHTTAQYMRCDGCTGNAGTGRVVIAPSSTLRNNVNQGNIAATVPGDPRGTSTARYAASIPWYSKFSGQFPPYNNDQHPFLIWNMYRFNPDGSLEQVGRSGVKQAFLTVNDACMDSSDHNSHVLGRGCYDTYSTSNNDFTNGLSPRSEILPASGRWGRCGSTFDPDCNGVMNSQSEDGFSQRMIVRESQISPTANPGAQWMLESWYLARQDIDIYNSMSTLRTTQAWTGSVWNVGYSDEKLGPAIDRWVPPAKTLVRGQLPPVTAGTRGTPGGTLVSATARPRGGGLRAPTQMNVEFLANGGHAKLAVRAIDLGNGSWRYHYAVMNLDITFFTTTGSEPNLRVTANRGFDSFALATSAAITAPAFRDGDAAATDWAYTQPAGAPTWSNTGGSAATSLFWGTLYSFSITSTAPPAHGIARLGTTAGGGQTFDVATLVPSG